MTFPQAPGARYGPARQTSPPPANRSSVRHGHPLQRKVMELSHGGRGWGKDCWGIILCGGFGMGERGRMFNQRRTAGMGVNSRFPDGQATNRKLTCTYCCCGFGKFVPVPKPRFRPTCRLQPKCDWPWTNPAEKSSDPSSIPIGSFTRTETAHVESIAIPLSNRRFTVTQI